MRCSKRYHDHLAIIHRIGWEAVARIKKLAEIVHNFRRICGIRPGTPAAASENSIAA
jgi:hypothetical protein